MKQFAKLHVARALGGMVCAAAVTPDKANDSPYLREMPTGMPRGYGHMPADAQCCIVENRRAVQDSGRRRIIDPRTDYTIEGEDARAEMLMFLEEHPGTFRKLLRKRNNAESIFSSMKERFGGVVRAVKAKTQTVELLSMCVYHNMTFAWGLRYGGGEGPRAWGSLRSNAWKRPETGPARPSGARGGPIVEDQRRHFRWEHSETAWLALRIARFWTRPRGADHMPPSRPWIQTARDPQERSKSPGI